MQDREQRMQRDIELLESDLATMESNPKTKPNALERKKNEISDKRKDLQDLKADIDELQNKMQGYGLDGKLDGYGGGGDSNNPYRKIAEGISEILPDQGQLADLFVGGATETLLPPGFDNPFDWSSLKSAAGVMGFVSGLMPDPVSRSLLGAGAAGLSGSGSGVVEAIKGIIPEPFGRMPSVFPGEDGSAVGPDEFTPGGAAAPFAGGAELMPLGPGAGGPTVDNSLTIENSNANAAELMDRKTQQNRQMLRKTGRLV